MKMKWNNLLSEKRERISQTTPLPFRNTFDMDYERIICSSSVRRLQDKAQVFPLQENDFTRTRLTHSIEVSSIGRSIGKRVGHALVEQGKMGSKEADALSSLLAVSGLVHDLGNPPFGHYGEAIIREFIKKKFASYSNEPWVKDFIFFDGNAQTIRILSRLQCLGDRYGMNFSFGTLGALLKYPWASDHPFADKEMKIGFFQTEAALIKQVLLATGMKQGDGPIMRNPVTYLLEAADDISYRFADLEDAAKKGYLPWEEVKKTLFKVAQDSKPLEILKSKLNAFSKNNKRSGIHYQELVQNEAMMLRVLCQGICIEQIEKEFFDNYNSIMAGEYDKKELLDCLPLKNFIYTVKDIAQKNIYNNTEVISLELVGKTVLTSLLEKFVSAVLDTSGYLDTRTESGKLYHLISNNFKHIQFIDANNKYQKNKKLTEQQKIQLVIDFVSGMTDSYALKLHKILTGTALPYE